MGAVTSAVLVMLACSPDMMLCREPAGGSVVFASLAECNAALALRLAEANGGAPKVIGRCVPPPDETAPGRWGISPNGDLFSAGASDVITVAEVTEAAPKAPPKGPATVRVTRNTSSGTETTDYTVSRK